MTDTVHTMAEDSEREDPRAKADREETALFNSFIQLGPLLKCPEPPKMELLPRNKCLTHEPMEDFSQHHLLHNRRDANKVLYQCHWTKHSEQPRTTGDFVSRFWRSLKSKFKFLAWFEGFREGCDPRCSPGRKYGQAFLGLGICFTRTSSSITSPHVPLRSLSVCLTFSIYDILGACSYFNLVVSVKISFPNEFTLLRQ